MTSFSGLDSLALLGVVRLRHGLVRFIIPYVGEHLAEYGATDALRSIARSTGRRAARSIDPSSGD